MKRGALLMEAMVALAVFAAGAIAVLATVRQGVSSMRAAHDRAEAIDLAASALARLDAGLASVETLDGEVPEWTDPAEPGGAFEDAPPEPTGWTLALETQASTHGSLTVVTVTASREAGASFTLTELVNVSRGRGPSDEAVDVSAPPIAGGLGR